MGVGGGGWVSMFKRGGFAGRGGLWGEGGDDFISM